MRAGSIRPLMVCGRLVTVVVLFFRISPQQRPVLDCDDARHSLPVHGTLYIGKLSVRR